MATEALKSTSVTNLDASPIVPNTTGEYAQGELRTVEDSVVATTGVTAPSTYRIVRVPTNAKIKYVGLRNAALSTSTAADIDVAFSDQILDGTQNQLQGGVVQITGPVDNKLFGSAISLAAANGANGWLEETFANSFTVAFSNTPLWSVLVQLGATQFSADPGGYFDIMVKTTTTVTAGGLIALRVDYVM